METTATAPGGNFTVADLAAASLYRHGVREVFGQSLPTLLHLADAEIGIRQITYRTESSGAQMADGYARISGRIGVVTAQNGPAATLLVPGLMEALTASVPILALIQEVPRAQHHKHAFQEIDHRALFHGCVKWFERVDRADRLEDYIDRAITIATSGRAGPVALSLPPDLLAEACGAEARRSAVLGHYPLDRPVPERARLARAMELIAGAEAPIMVVGGGAHLSGAAAEVARFQEEIAIPVVTTMSGKGAMDETHPLSLGVSGGVSGRLGRCRHLVDLVESADVVFLVGTRMGFSATEAWSLYRNATTLIHLDIDPAEIGLNYEAERLVGDVGGTLRAMLDDLPRPDLSKREAARGQVAARIAEGLARHRADIRDLTTADRLPLRPERMMTLLGELLPEDAIVTADASSATQWVLNYMEARRPGQRFLSPRGLAGLGWGYPMALGAKLARPEATVVSVVGDGGFAHNWAELETAVRMDLPVIVVVLNNGVLGYQVYGELTKYRRFTDACELRPVDHAQIARACGVDAVVVDSATGFADALRQALASGRSMLIDAICDPKAYPPVTALDPVEPLIDLTPVPEKQRRAGGEAG